MHSEPDQRIVCFPCYVTVIVLVSSLDFYMIKLKNAWWGDDDDDGWKECRFTQD